MPFIAAFLELARGMKVSLTKDPLLGTPAVKLTFFHMRVGGPMVDIYVDHPKGRGSLDSVCFDIAYEACKQFTARMKWDGVTDADLVYPLGSQSWDNFVHDVSVYVKMHFLAVEKKSGKRK